MSPTLPEATSTSFSAPFFSVTSRRPSGRKAIAQGSSNFAASVAVNGRASLPAACAGSAAGAAGSDGFAALPEPVQATRHRLAVHARASRRGVMAMPPFHASMPAGRHTLAPPPRACLREDRMLPATETSCPYCGEPIELLVDGSAGDQQYIEDCS